MVFAFRRRGALLSLLLVASAAVCAQPPVAPAAGQPAAAATPQATTPAARQQARDRNFLLRRGIGVVFPSSSNGAIAAGLPVQAMAAARMRSFALHTAARSTHLSLSTAPATATTAGNTTNWQSAGPVQLSTSAYGLVTGRVSSLAVDPNDTSGNTVYLGATGGGVWKSINAAGNAASVTFSPLTDDLSVFANSMTSIPSLSIGAISVEPGNPNVLLAGTGDPNDALDSYYGVGILRSTNAGQTWSLVSQSSDGNISGMPYSFQGVGFAGFAWSNTTAGLVVAAASQSLEGLLVNTQFATTAETGLYYSSDSGQTWHLATVSDGPNKIIQSNDPATSPPGNPATSVVWNAHRALFIAAIRFHGYYSSSDGINWTRLATQPGANLSTQQCPANPGGTGSTSCPIYRGVLAVQPVTGDTFALTTDLNNVDQGLYQDVCATGGSSTSSCTSSTLTFGTQINDTALDDPQNPGTIDQADYNLAIAAVSSQQDTILLAGTEDIYRCSLANSCTWRNTTNDQTCAAAQVAPSTHAIDGTFGANGLIFFGNDGGLWRTTDTLSQSGAVCASTDASHFQNLNGGIGSLAEISHLTVSPSSPSLVLAGMNGFGVVASESTAAQGGSGPWQQLATGEGSYVAIDPTTPANWYAGIGAGLSIFNCADGANCGTGSFGTTPVISRSDIEDDADYFLDPAPWMLDPLDSSNIIVGTCRMWLGPVTGGWTSSNLLSGMLDGDNGPFCDGNAALRSIGAGGSYNSAQGGEQMYAGMAGPLDGGGTVPGHIYGATVPQGGGQVAWTDLWRNQVTNASLNPQFNAGGYAISSISVDSRDPTGKTVYVGIGGFPYSQSGVLYGSTDGGAHWTNLNNNLPPAPVNRVLVDPNNAGYVYVAGDFGIYYTSNIATCSSNTQNCWSVLGSGLPNAPVTDLQIYRGNSSSILEASTYGRGIWTIGLSTTAVTPQATLSPSSYTFPAQASGSKSTTVASFTLTNIGGVSVTISGISVSSSDYAETNNCGASLASNGNCTIQVSFTPGATGDRPGTLTVTANTQAGRLTAALDGNGLTPGAISLGTSSLNFPATATGASSQPMSVTLTNTGQAPVTMIAGSIAGTDPNDFSLQSNSCPASLPAGASCTVPVVFNPYNLGTRRAQLQISSSAQGSPLTVTLTGNAVSPAALTLSPTSLAFTATPQGSVSQAQSITVSNSGGATAQLGTASVSSDYLISGNTCGSTLAPSATCVVSIEFQPQATGSRAGLFTLQSPSIPAGKVTASLSGTGLQPSSVAFSPATYSFAPQQQGTTSATQTFSVTNSAGSSAQLGAATINGDFAIASNGCTGTLAVGGSCSITVTFTPTSLGQRSGTLALAYNGSSSATAALSGSGIAPGTLGFSPSSLSFAATAENTTSASQPVTVTNTGGNPAQISSVSVSQNFTITANTCPAAPQTLAVNASCTLSVAFAPSGVAAYSGVVTLTGNFSNSPAQIALSGQGAAPAAATLSPSTLTFSAAQGSASAPQTVTITSTGGVPVTFGTASVPKDYQITNNTCVTPLAPGQSCSLAILFHPGITGPENGMLTQPGNMTGSPLMANLNGTGLAPGKLAITPSAFAFSSEVIGATSPPQSFTVQNTGGVSVAVGTPATSPADYVLAGSCPATLAPNASCTLTVSFKPTAAGDRAGTLTVPGDGSGSAVATLDGTATTPGQLAASPSSLGFGTVATGSTSNATVAVTNSGGTPVHLSAIAAGGDFSVSGGTCSVSAAIPANGSCTVIVTFAPSTTGSRTGALVLTGDSSPATLQVPLAGVGATPGTLSLSPASVQFNSVVINTSSAAQTITAANSGGVAVSLGMPSISGIGYSITANGCGSSLAAGASCSVQVAFAPASAGDSTGSFSLPGQYAGVTRTVALDGNGVTPGALAFTPSQVQFGSVVTNTTATQTLVMKNTGGASVALGPISAASPFAVTSQCGSTLAPSQTCALQLSYTPNAPGALSGLLTVNASVTGGNVTVALSGTGVPAGALAASPASLAFPSTSVSGVSASQQVTFRNPGGVSVPLAAAQMSSGDYIITGNSCGAGLDPGATCTVSVAFSPAAAGDRSGTLTLAGSASNSPAAHVALDGTGLAPAHLVFSPAALSFASEAENTTSASQTLTLSNTGGISTSLGVAVLSGEYKITSNTCGSSLAAGATCGIAVQFAPTSDGSAPGTLSIASTNGTPSAAASVNGTGLALALSPISIAFTPSLPIGTTSAPVLIAVENLGTTPIALQAPHITGDFALGSSSCGPTLAANASCAINVTFTPSAGGMRTGTFTISDGVETAQTALSGQGLAPATDALAPLSLSFGATVVGTASAVQSITLTNSGDATLTGISVQVAGPFTASNNCGASLGGHLSCSIAVSFAPVDVGAAVGTLTVTDIIHAQSVALTGESTAPARAFASPSSLDFGSYAINASTPPQTVTVSNQGVMTMSGIKTLVNSADFSIASSTCGDSLAPGATCQLAVVFTPPAAGTQQGTLTVSSTAGAEPLIVNLQGAGEDFSLAVLGSTSDVITSGQTATYQLQVTPVGASTGTLTISCAGAPAASVCTPNPSTLTLSSGTTGSITLSVQTAVSATAAAHPASRRGWLAGSALALLFPFCFLRGEHRRRFLLILLALGLLGSPIACGVHASGVNDASKTLPGQTPSGSYTLTVSAVFPGAVRTATVQLIVQ